MILVFGGTTEGRKAAEVLEEAGTVYYYSTKTGEQDISLHHGQRVDGGMDSKGMVEFCQEHDIRLLVDAAHPFASLLHQTVAETANTLDIPVIRYERIYPAHDQQLTWIDDYSQVPTDIQTLLATTGVKSIAKLKYLEKLGINVFYRILPRESSIMLAKQQGATDDQLCYYKDGNSIEVDADAILLKESGLTGGFTEKVEAARRQGMRIFVLKRPAWPTEYKALVNGPHGLRRMVEHLLPAFFPLHSGLTTGTCATAAAIAAAKQLLTNERPNEVPVVLPDGETIMVAVGYGEGYGEGYAYCIKEAGDDPDMTDGLEIRASLSLSGPSPDSPLQEGEWIVIKGGEGVGRFTLPGFDYPPGEAAINKGPREMIRTNLARHITPFHTGSGRGWLCTISVPDGAEVAQKTFNPRLGIEGGISIIGVSGIVKPFSEEAFISSIRKCMEVAKASGSERVVINSGAKSERFVKACYPDLPRQAFVEYGNYIGETLKMADELQIPRITLGVMLGKAVKLAAGQLDTHSRRATMDREFIGQMLDEAQCTITQDYTLARELWQAIPKEKIEDFCHVVLSHCLIHCQPLVPQAELTLLLIDDDGTIHPL